MENKKRRSYPRHQPPAGHFSTAPPPNPNLFFTATNKNRQLPNPPIFLRLITGPRDCYTRPKLPSFRRSAIYPLRVYILYPPIAVRSCHPPITPPALPPHRKKGATHAAPCMYLFAHSKQSGSFGGAEGHNNKIRPSILPPNLPTCRRLQRVLLKPPAAAVPVAVMPSGGLVFPLRHKLSYLHRGCSAGPASVLPARCIGP